MGNKEFNILEFYIAITNRCNLQCLMCTTGQGKYDAQKELTTGEWKRVIANLNRHCNIQRITFGGGEPLLRSDIAELMKFSCATDIVAMNIISNGTLLTEEFVTSFTEKELQKIAIIFSIDGLEYSHNFIRGSGKFEKTFRNFEFLYHNYFRPGKIRSLAISSILMPENFADYVPFLDFFKKYEGVTIDIQPVIPNNEICYIKKEFMLTNQETKKLHEIVHYITEHPLLSGRPLSMIKYYPLYFDNKLTKSGRCLTGYESLNITYEGYPYLCGKEIRIPLSTVDFKEIFHSPDYQNELERIKQCMEPCLQGLHINPENYYEAERTDFKAD